MKFAPKFRTKWALAAVAAAAAVAIAIPAVAVAQAGSTTGAPTAAAASLVRYAADDPGGSTVTSSAAPTSTADGGTAAPAPKAKRDTAKPAKAKPAKTEHGRLAWLRDHRLALDKVAHAQWTAKNKDGSFVTHDVIHGDVSTAVAGATAGTSSITVTAADETSQTYTASSTTKVWKVTETNGKRHVEKATVTDVTSGSEVIVEGTGSTSPYAADRILVQLKK